MVICCTLIGLAYTGKGRENDVYIKATKIDLRGIITTVFPLYAEKLSVATREKIASNTALKRRAQADRGMNVM